MVPLFDVAAVVLVLGSGLGLFFFRYINRSRDRRTAYGLRRRYETLYNAAASALWVVDLSALHNNFLGHGVRDLPSLEKFLARVDERELNLQGLVRVREVNWASVELFVARNKSALLKHVNQVCLQQSLPVTALNSRGVREGVWNLDFEIVLPDCEGHDIALWVNAALPLFQSGFDDVLVTLIDITDRQRMAKRLVETEGFWKHIVESVPDLVYVNDQEKKQIRYANREVGEMLGYSSNDIHDFDRGYWSQLVHPDDKQTMQQATHKAANLEPGEILETRFRMRHRNGQWRWMYFRNRVFEQTDAGGVKSYLGLGRDITAEYEAKRQIEEREEHYRLLAENMADVVWTTDRNFQIRYISPSVTRVFGYSPQEVIGTKIFDLFPDDQIDVFRAEIRQHIRRHRSQVDRENAFIAKDVYSLEMEAQCKSGRAITIELSLSFLVDTFGKIQGVTGTCRDISSRCRAENDLRMAAGVFENSTEAIVIADSNGEIIQVNRAFSGITGYAPTEVEGRSIPAVLGIRNRHQIDDLWWHLDEHGFWQSDISLVRRGGNPFPAWMGMTAIHDDREKLVSYIAIFSDVSERKANEEAIHRLAFYDELTGLANRTLMSQELNRCVERNQRGDFMIALLYLDLDRFKPVNDSLGHAAGDKLLQDVADRLRQCVRDGDLVSRMGGDEFTILLGVTSENEGKARRAAIHVARKVLAGFELPFSLMGREIFISASIGIAVAGRDGVIGTELLKNADTAMYYAKGKGRNNYQFYMSDMNSRAMERLELENDLRRAVEQHQLKLEYQPQISAKSGAAVGMEALLRWDHPEKGRLMPAQFITIAEESGVIISIGRWVIQEACQQLVQWRKDGVAIERVAVNLSAIQLNDDVKLVDVVSQALQNTGIDPGMLELEITESMMMENVDSVMQVLRRLKALGVRISVDDFGTGYSSLSYLRQFPLDTLKIDKSFIRTLPGGENDEQIVRAIVAIAHSLKLGVIAEGVENEAQQELLTLLGCEEVQGFLFGRALPPDNVLDWFEQTELTNTSSLSNSVSALH
ncbi:MAG: EAL domain-containing protein [Pseudomonadales bacterium]|nr:EAL domain-containing protein [Pseudomonadales bacterium]